MFIHLLTKMTVQINFMVLQQSRTWNVNISRLTIPYMYISLEPVCKLQWNYSIHVSEILPIYCVSSWIPICVSIYDIHAVHTYSSFMQSNPLLCTKTGIRCVTHNLILVKWVPNPTAVDMSIFKSLSDYILHELIHWLCDIYEVNKDKFLRNDISIVIEI